MIFRSVVLAILLAVTIQAQDLQTRIIFHPTFPLKKSWYLTGWSITNLRQKSPSNTNLFGGLGYQGQTWWLEGMLQRQWSRKRRETMLDFRFQKTIKKTSLYLEAAPFLSRKAFYEFVVLEQKLWRGLGVGGETENVHQPGPDYLVVGSRISFPLLSLGKFKFRGALAYRFRKAPGQNELRFYLIGMRNFKR